MTYQIDAVGGLERVVDLDAERASLQGQGVSLRHHCQYNTPRDETVHTNSTGHGILGTRDAWFVCLLGLSGATTSIVILRPMRYNG